MSQHTKIRKIGNSLGVILPKETLAEMNVEEGQALYITKADDGSLRLAPSDEDFEKSMKVFEGLNRRYRNALNELAK
ncbi:MAG: AbrB/MazE/SpoVT family DNA-binding domain-containing protein [Verrucomicrobiia bacterium]|tara:strand:+ start:16376 stop:16606 length:231 start_codon:yes stop_codon:yes gene_type:complete